MARFGGVHEKRWCAGRGQRRGDFATNVAGFTHAGYDHTTFAVQNQVNGFDEMLVQMCGLVDERGGFDVQYFAGGVQYLLWLHILVQ